MRSASTGAHDSRQGTARYGFEEAGPNSKLVCPTVALLLIGAASRPGCFLVLKTGFLSLTHSDWLVARHAPGTACRCDVQADVSTAQLQYPFGKNYYP